MQKLKQQLHRQDLVMKLKTEKNSVLQRELTQAKKRMTGASKAGGTVSERQAKLLKEKLKKEIERACALCDVVEQERRLREQQNQLKLNLKETSMALQQLDARSESEDNDEDDDAAGPLAERHQALQEQFDYVESQVRH